MTTQITYRRTRNNEWVAFGPADQITAGEIVVITRKDGTISRRLVESVGRVFIVDGVEMVYGYLAIGEMPEKSFEETKAAADERIRAERAAWEAEKAAEVEAVEAVATEVAAPAAPRYVSRYRRTSSTGCKRCGGHLSSYDREVAAISGYHADCL